jgi:HlyD family secretion protein
MRRRPDHHRGLAPSMPAEVHIETDRRAALSYFLKPLTDQMSRSFKEG